jgi:hypothetical protein
VDDDTYLFHLRRGDYSRWIREAVSDDDLGREIRAIEKDPATSPAESVRLVRDAIERRYMIPRA